MGMTIWVNIRNGATRHSNEEDHSLMFALREQLDSIATDLGVQKLSDFFDDTELKFSYGPIDDFAETEESSEESWNNDDARWFSPQAGMATLNAILDYLERSPSELDLSKQPWNIARLPERLIEELQDCKTELMQAMEKGHLFHFCILD
jgi:hypothetical protein